jgi:TRAP transporter TAXI family solute receptor
MQKISPSYMRNTIPAGTYKGVDYEVRTMGNAQHLIVSADLDTEFVYQMTKSIVEHLKEIGEGHAVYAKLTPELMAQDLNMPMHPGAEKYYKEIGVMK